MLCSFRTFHGYKTMKDFVRRRRWARLVHFFALLHIFLLPKTLFLSNLGWKTLTDASLYKKSYLREFLCHRKCKISLTGPWQTVPPLALTDVTVLPCLAQCSLEQVPVWAISEKGDVLCRLGVTVNNPAVRNKPSLSCTHLLSKTGSCDLHNFISVETARFSHLRPEVNTTDAEKQPKEDTSWMVQVPEKSSLVLSDSFSVP